MASSLPLVSLLSLLSLLTLASSSPPTSTTTSTLLSLSPITYTPYTTPYQRLNHLATSSKTRAHHLKNPLKKTEIPVFPHSGGYSISLSFGTPPQTLSLLLDTGSSLVWVPCTKGFNCTNCNISWVNSSNTSPFLPSHSSTAEVLGCKSPKCAWLFGSGNGPQCQACGKSSGNCSTACPGYVQPYGSGSTSGILLSETLDLPGKFVEDFVVGCSVIATEQPLGTGIVGFGRGLESLPSQMGLRKFSYCLVSHQFDDTSKTSELVLVGGSDSGAGKPAEGLSYTPLFQNNLGNNSAFKEYYYVNLRKITVGGKTVRVPYRFLVPGSDGNGGTIVDSGTTFTFMEGKLFDMVAREFETQMAQYSRVLDMENQIGLSPCFNVSSGKLSASIPKLTFHFKGGAKMVLPSADYFSLEAPPDVKCLTITTDSSTGAGPSIILGNYQQQDFYLEFDLKNERLGIRKQTCK